MGENRILSVIEGCEPALIAVLDKPQVSERKDGVEIKWNVNYSGRVSPYIEEEGKRWLPFWVLD